MPWPVKSTLMVSREREPVTGSTSTSTAARIGPSMPRTPQVLGGSICTSSDVEARLAPPIRRGVHTSVQALETDIREWIATWNTNPRPFTWTKTADEILNSLADYLAKIRSSPALNQQD